MPPAFNLSQDQTLQFDLEFTHKGIEETRYKLFFNLHERLKSIRPRLATFDSHSSWHSPSNAHAYRLLIFKELAEAGACCVALISYQHRSGIMICFQNLVKQSAFAPPSLQALMRQQRSPRFYTRCWRVCKRFRRSGQEASAA